MPLILSLHAINIISAGH